jgi:hypothetical protein
MLTSCTGLTQLTVLHEGLDDQGLGVLLTHGTSIKDMTLGRTHLTTSKAHWPCSWQKLTLSDATLPEYAYLPLKSVQQLGNVLSLRQAPLGRLPLPGDGEVAQLPSLLHQAATNLASCPGWTKAAPSELELYGPVSLSGLTSAQRVELLQALAPVAATHVQSLKLEVDMQLGRGEVEVLGNILGGSLTSLYLGGATLMDSFWKPLAERFPHLQKLYLASTTKTVAVNLAMYLATVSCCSTDVLEISIAEYVLSTEDSLQLKASVEAWGLQDIRLTFEELEEEEKDDSAL